ncbi:MAG: hypothetical protein HXS54_17675 [Theionarchaea archaeon]|nr:hypothetical protein [Theionarchaea archaeon]
MELKFDRDMNREERLKFIRFYAEWVKKVPNEVWSKQQAELINSFVRNARNFKMSKEGYLRMVESKTIGKGVREKGSEE